MPHHRPSHSKISAENSSEKASLRTSASSSKVSNDNVQDHQYVPTIPPASPTVSASDRLDRWLWCARLVKTRGKVEALITEHGVVVAGREKLKPATLVRIGDTLTVRQDHRIVVVTVVGVSLRRVAARDVGHLYTLQGSVTQTDRLINQSIDHAALQGAPIALHNDNDNDS